MAKTYTSSIATQKNGSVPTNVDPSVTTESTRELRRYAAQVPRMLPMTNDRIWVTPTRMTVHSAVCPIMCVTVYGK